MTDKTQNGSKVISRRDFVKVVAAFLAFFSLGGLGAFFKPGNGTDQNLLTKNDRKTVNSSGYGSTGYGG